ncbi:MAG: AMP-binding protein, partial [Candidatus Dormibacteraeota bacterium]|nr:AMP-binding protein [Candidatus Dormibacteraeota bacterium]
MEMAALRHTSLHGLLSEYASATPLAPAVLAPQRAPLTYSGFLVQVERAAAVLQACGIGREDRVAVVLPNGPEMAVCFL